MSLPLPGSTSGTSEKDHLLAVAKQTGKLPAKLAEQPKCPEAFAHLWQWFLEIQTSESLTFAEIEAWSRLTHRRITGQEAAILRRLDSIYLKVINERSRLTRNPGSVGSSQPRR